MNADHWNEMWPVGTPVRYYPIRDEPEHIDSRTRTPAWTLGHGAPVVSIEGIAGGVLLSHVMVLAGSE